MIIDEISTLTKDQIVEFQSLLKELVPDAIVTTEQIAETVDNPDSHVFGAFDEAGLIRGCAVLCINTLLTGKQATVENVIVSASCRGKHVGKALMEYLIEYARTHYGDIVLNLTSNPKRIAANNLYRSLGFQQRETNVYKLELKH